MIDVAAMCLIELMLSPKIDSENVIRHVEGVVLFCPFVDANARLVFWGFAACNKSLLDAATETSDRNVFLYGFLEFGREEGAVFGLLNNPACGIKTNSKRDQRNAKHCCE